MTTITSKNFSAQIGAMKSADGNQRGRLQGLVVFSIAHAMENSNSFNYLDRVITACYELTVGRPTIMRDFIQHCIEGVKLTKVKGSDERRFKKESPGTKIRYTYPDPENIPNWWEWHEGRKNGGNKKPFDLEKGIARLAKRAASEGQATSIDSFRRQVDAIMADTEFAAIFADAGVTVSTADEERKAA